MQKLAFFITEKVEVAARAQLSVSKHSFHCCPLLIWQGVLWLLTLSLQLLVDLDNETYILDHSVLFF